LRNAGADVEVMTPETALAENGLDWRPAVAARTVVLVGGIHVNRALLPLYAGYLALGDAAYPGPGGYVVRTICRPFGPDTAAVAVEASDGEGTRAGVSRLVELIEAHPGALPATLEARLAGAALARARQAPDPGMRYLLTGDAAEAQPAVTRLLAAVTPGQGFAPHGDYGIERWVREYNHIQDAPGVTAEQVLQLDQALLLTSLSTTTEYWRRHDGQIIGGRHQTMGTSAITAVVHLLRRRGAADLEAATLLDQWWNECLAFWRHATSTFHDDLEGIPSYYCPEPTLDWALQLGAAEYVRTQLPLAVLRAYAVVDNLGFYAGTGTYEECRPGDVYKPVPWQWLLQAAGYFHPQRGFDELCRALGGRPLFRRRQDLCRRQ
jgi:hypothetical protein